MKALKKLTIIVSRGVRARALARVLSGAAIAAAFGLPYAVSAATVGTIVRMETSIGGFNIGLYDSDVPETVTNFLGYVTRNDYDDTIIHRSEPDFVIQGGGYKSLLPDPGVRVVAQGPISNQSDPSRPNIKRTIAMARTGDPNSATSEWFFNLVNNTTKFSNVPGQGYAVFGEVLDAGWRAVEQMAALPVQVLSQFTRPPLVDGNYFAKLGDANFVKLLDACINTDRDAACPEIEDQAPNSDGNSDSVFDRDQANVTSLLNPELNNTPVTFAARNGMRFEIATAGRPAGLEKILTAFKQPADKLIGFDQGVFQFVLTTTGTMNPAGETVTVFDRATAPPTRYYWYDSASASWKEFAGAVIQSDRIILNIVDNGAGDNDPTDGIIDHLGAPAYENARPNITHTVRIETSSGSFNVGLYRDAVPATVDNFLAYLNNRAYNNTLIHFSKRDVRVQGGGFTSLAPVPFHVTETGPIPNDSDATRPNVRGTISMWWNDGPNAGPASATTEWFFNLGSNFAFDSPTAGQGKAVFGEVLDAGMDVLDRIAALPTQPFDPILMPPLPNGFFFALFGDKNFVSVYRVCMNVDRDGVCPEFEDFAPNGGDGNSDGTPDRDQPEVASTRLSANGRSITFAARTGMRFDEAGSFDLESSAVGLQIFVPPPGVVARFDDGAYRFTMIALTGTTMNPAGETVTLFDRAATRPTRYYALESDAQGTPTSWYDFTFDGTTGAEILPDRIVLHFVDGGRGDDDGNPNNGSIRHIGAPAVESPIPPPARNNSGCTIAKGSRRMPQAADWGIVAAFLAFAFARARGRRSGFSRDPASFGAGRG